MTESNWLAEGFEQNRTRLRAVAYRMLGSIAERPTTPSRRPGCA
jgi:RNA polymerase sigma-70 factor, ECF subfamily